MADLSLGQKEGQSASKSAEMPLNVTSGEVQKRVAGEEGFEPSHAGIKIQCLNQLGDSPTRETCFSTRFQLIVAGDPSVQRMNLQIAANPPSPSFGGVG